MTTYSGPDVAELHDRMPMVIEEADWPVWLGEAEGDPAALLRPPACGTLRIWPVSRKVNRPANNAPELLQPLENGEERWVKLAAAAGWRISHP